MKNPVKNFMTAMPRTIGHDIDAEKAKIVMEELNCRHLPVLNGGQLVGVLSLKDLEVVEKLDRGFSTPVEELMTNEPVVVDPDIGVEEAVLKMKNKSIHSVIVRAKNGSPWGIFTSTNALEYLSRD